MWVADIVDEKIYAYSMSTKARDSAKDFDTLKAAGNTDPQGIWSDGTTMWVVNDKSFTDDDEKNLRPTNVANQSQRHYR